MRNGASDRLARSSDLRADEIFDLYTMQLQEELLPIGGDHELERCYLESMVAVALASRLYKRGGVQALLDDEDEAIVAFGVAIDSGDSSHLAI